MSVTLQKNNATPITLTYAAALKTWEFIQEEEDNSLKLKIAISGKGCHGFQYEPSLSNTVGEEDTVITKSIQTKTGETVTVGLVIDPVSLQFLRGVEVDYESDVSQGRFILRNLKAKTTCSCGHSFSVESDDSSDTDE